jgi:hypothetical protein
MFYTEMFLKYYDKRKFLTAKIVTLVCREKIAYKGSVSQFFSYSYEIVQFYNCTVCYDMFYNAVAAAYRCAEEQQLPLHSCQMSRDVNPTIVSCFVLD